MIRMIATDMDGTLLEPGGVLPEGFFSVARELLSMGITFTVASGRQYDNLRRLFQPIAQEICFICENGGLNAVGSQIISTSSIERGLVMEIIKTLENHQLCVLVSGVRCCYVTPENRSFCDKMFYHQRNTLALVDDFHLVEDEFIKVSAYCETGIAPYLPKLIERWGARINTACAGEQWCDFTLANKGTGMRDIMGRLGLQREEVAAFGDNYNDVSMFERAGHPFLMKSADPRLMKPGIRTCEKVLPVLKSIVEGKGELPSPT